MKLEQAVNDVIVMIYNVALQSEGSEWEEVLKRVPEEELYVIVWLCLPVELQITENFQKMKAVLMNRHINIVGKECVELCQWDGINPERQKIKDIGLEIRKKYFVFYFIQDITEKLDDFERTCWLKSLAYYVWGDLNKIDRRCVEEEQRKLSREICKKIVKICGNTLKNLKMTEEEMCTFKNQIEDMHEKYREQCFGSNSFSKEVMLKERELLSTIILGYTNWRR